MMAMRAALAAPRGLRRLFCTNLTSSSTFPFVPPPPSEAAPARQMAEPSTNLFVSVGISQDKSRKLREEASLKERYEQWMAKYGKVYKDAAEKEKRFLIFKDNVDYIESANAAGNKSYTLGANNFADLTREEYKSRLNRFMRCK